MSIGVLALQGDFDLHRKALDRLGIESVEVRLPRQLDQIGGLIMPGGESTTLLKLLDEWEFVPALEKFHAAGNPIMGTCAGLILLARDVESPKQPSLGFIDITAVRNAYGRQKESFETEGEADLGDGPRPIATSQRWSGRPPGSGTSRSTCPISQLTRPLRGGIVWSDHWTMRWPLGTSPCSWFKLGACGWFKLGACGWFKLGACGWFKLGAC